MCNFFFCHYVFKKLSAAEASESIYMRERVNGTEGSEDSIVIVHLVSGKFASSTGNAVTQLNVFKSSTAKL